MIAALTFLLSFRANFGYNRYWEAFTAVHQMHTKWLDVGMELAAFHLQSAHYEKPPAFGQYPELSEAVVERKRRREREQTMDELQSQLEEMTPKGWQRRWYRWTRRQPTSKRDVSSDTQRSNKVSIQTSIHLDPKRAKQLTKSSGSTMTLHTSVVSQPRRWDEDCDPLFLEEAAHLLSLMSAVAFSTLRNDLEQADSPLITYQPGAPFPHVDPDDYNADVRQGWTNSHRSVAVCRYLFGWSRTPESRTLYNAARPFRVIGGVSDGEIELLQCARGPSAKVALCTLWLQEFISREYLNGSTGAVAAPILSRLYQFISDGMIGYNQARKVAYIPFPFPHAQITSLIVLAVACTMPLLMLDFVSNAYFGFFLNLLTVMSFTGLHEVARELENPFANVPNDVPLNNFQGQFNEALLTMFSGYHPDAFWEVKDVPELSSSTRGSQQEVPKITDNSDE